MNAMNPNQQPTLQLRDIHLPDPVSWWPLAPGWWLAIAIIIVVCIFVAVFVRRYQHKRYRRLGLQHLTTIECDEATQQDHRLLIQRLSKLLRHMSVLHYSQHCAGLEGQAWLVFLDKPFHKLPESKNQPFSAGVGQCLATGPYQKEINDIDTVALFALCRVWMKKLPLPPKQRGLA